jgi:hypothetical protein
LCHWISRCVFHLAEALSIRGKHKALLAPDARLNPKTHLLQLHPDFQAKAAFARVDQEGDDRAGAKELRYLGEGSLDSPQRVLTCDQADRVLRPWNAARRSGGHANESTPSERKIQFHSIAAGDDGSDAAWISV